MLLTAPGNRTPLKSKEEVYFFFILSINAIDPYKKLKNKTEESKPLMLLDKS